MKIDTEILCSFIDGELDVATAAAVRTALAADESLRQEYEDLRKTAELVRGLPKVSAPGELLEAVMANAEREQLLGMPGPAPRRRTGLYWGLSIAASLMIGAALGVLGYHHGLQDEPEMGGGPALVMQAKDESGDVREWYFGDRGDSPARINNGVVLGRAKSSRKGGEEIAVLTKSGRKVTAIHSKGDVRITRSSPSTGMPTKSISGVEAVAGASEAYKEQIAEDQMGRSIAAAEEAQQELEYAEEHKRYRAGDMDLRTKGSPADAVVMGDMEGYVRTKAGEQLPLDIQVRTNNFVNQSMASNQRFEAEPINVKVFSNDPTKTLQYVRQWALKNSLIDLNTASPKVNFPVYTQVVYQGKAGANIAPANQNGILLRTTRSQARQIVTELQRQEPVVVSVSVKDKKNSLGFPVRQFGRERLPLAGGERFGAHQRQQIPAESQAVEVAKPEMSTQMGIALKSKPTDGGDKDSDTAAGFQGGQTVAVPATRGIRTKTEGNYLFQITNQMQVRSLEELITLVVLVADASGPAKLRQSSQITCPPPTHPEATESK